VLPERNRQGRKGYPDMTYLDTPEDMQWLRDVHCKDMPETMTCAILEGNEDSPTKVEAWIINNPHYQAPADYVWTPAIPEGWTHVES
jgi:hypothetical protein